MPVCLSSYTTGQIFYMREGAECFYKTGQHDIAIKWLDRALKLSAAPELYYAIAENEKAIKQYRKAESYLLEISRILPEQGYTYFLLAKLYTNPSFYIRTNSIKQPRGFSPSSPVHKTT